MKRSAARIKFLRLVRDRHIGESAPELTGRYRRTALAALRDGDVRWNAFRLLELTVAGQSALRAAPTPGQDWIDAALSGKLRRQT